MLKVTAVIENAIQGDYLGIEEFNTTSDLMVAVLNRPQIDFYIRSYDRGTGENTPQLVCERYLRPIKRVRAHSN